MNNKFVIGNHVIRKLTESVHVIEDLRQDDKPRTILHPATGEFSEAVTWVYKISGFDFWIVEEALMLKPDDWVDPNAATKKRELVK